MVEERGLTEGNLFKVDPAWAGYRVTGGSIW
jgi:hypothetical protein